jgi:regulator of replication initiation timing
MSKPHHETKNEGILMDQIAELVRELRDAKVENERLRQALKRLSFAAQTTGGVAGRDEGLVAAIDNASQTLQGGTHD